MAGNRELGAEGLDHVIEQARRALAAAQSPGDPFHTADEQASPLQGEGSAARGRVQATVVAGGGLKSLSVDPRLMRLSAEEMCAEIVTAVNAAVDDLRANIVQQAGAPPEADELSSTLLTLQYESVRQLERFSQAVNDIVLRFERRA
ncbi:YbaB/EbfC family nucleoid-associated protein [Nonomuraea sp. H19]|uniref:YbaB/EbfC family nucleoid-associated protein n=1 Tax=Nonomuraea sp. H19 TaxID=3452206 RepID=UPI003F8ACB1E